MKRIVDPPSGWKYGYPKELMPCQSYRQQLLDSGYPPKDIDFAMRHTREWEEPDVLPQGEQFET